MDEPPKWNLPAPIKVQAKRPPKRRKSVDDAAPVSLILPDSQIDHYRNSRGKWDTTHDPAAMDAALVTLEWLARRRPIKHVVLLGDMLDLSQYGKYRRAPSFAEDCNRALATMAEWLGSIRSTVPSDTPLSWLEGNHEVRLQNWLSDHAAAAFGIRMNGDPDARPVVSIPHLLDLDELGVQYLDGYPSGEVWLEPDLMCVHGHLHGATAGRRYLATESVSVVHGHTHRRYMETQTTRSHGGYRTQVAASPGTLARIDGAVPSTLSGTDRNGCPVHRVQPWQQGLGVVQHLGESWNLDIAAIERGVAHVWGEQLAA